jgi:ATP-dependent exoDNAse (exonuclease V) alpha subunit
MRVEPVPTGKRYTMEDSETGLRITIRSREGPLSPGWYFILALGTLTLVGFTIFAIVIALTRGRFDPIGVHIVTIVITPLMMFYMLYIMLRAALGISEIIEVQPAVLVIRPVIFLGSKAFRAGRPRAYAVEHIRNLAVFRGDLGLALSFRYGTQTVYFAPRISEQGAEEIRAAIYGRLPSVAPVQADSSNSAQRA